MKIRFKKVSVWAVEPERATGGAAGYDLCAAMSPGDSIYILAGSHARVPTGIALELPNPFLEAQVRPRSGLAAKHGVTVLNAPGTIDSDFRGEIQVILINQGKEVFTVTPGMRIAQLVFTRVELPTLEEAWDLTDTERGDGGFGSTGV